MNQRVKGFLPDILSLSRVVVIPAIILFAAKGLIYLSAMLFTAAAISDLLDGYVARKFGIRNKRGWLIDAGADFVLIISLLAYFYLEKDISILTVILPSLSITIFFITGFSGQSAYDPVGKYIGFICYICIGIMLIMPFRITFILCDWLLDVYIGVSILFRFITPLSRTGYSSVFPAVKKVGITQREEMK